MNRQDHLSWCKERAMQYIDRGDLSGATTSFISDMGKHTETENHRALQLILLMRISGQLSTGNELRKFIDGFN